MNPIFEYGPDTVGPWHVGQVKVFIGIELGKNIARYRKQNGETISELAKALNVSEATMCKYENCEQEIPASLIPLISARYKICISELYGEPLPKKQASEQELFLRMITNTLKYEDDGWADFEFFNITVVEYFQKFLTTEANNSFDIFYALSNFLEQIGVNLNNFGILNSEKKQKAFESLIYNMERIQYNDYRITPSIFLGNAIRRMREND